MMEFPTVSQIGFGDWREEDLPFDYIKAKYIRKKTLISGSIK